MVTRISVKIDGHGPELVDQNGEAVEGIRLTSLGIGRSARNVKNEVWASRGFETYIEITGEVVILNIHQPEDKPKEMLSPMHWSGKPLRMIDMFSTNVEKPVPVKSNGVMRYPYSTVLNPLGMFGPNGQELKLCGKCPSCGHIENCGEIVWDKKNGEWIWTCLKCGLEIVDDREKRKK